MKSKSFNLGLVVGVLPGFAQLFDVALQELGAVLVRKFMRCSHCQKLGQLVDLASDWLFTLVQQIRSQLAC